MQTHILEPVVSICNLVTNQSFEAKVSAVHFGKKGLELRFNSLVAKRAMEIGHIYSLTTEKGELLYFLMADHYTNTTTIGHTCFGFKLSNLELMRELGQVHNASNQIKQVSPVTQQVPEVQSQEIRP